MPETCSSACDVCIVDRCSNLHPVAIIQLLKDSGVDCETKAGNIQVNEQDVLVMEHNIPRLTTDALRKVSELCCRNRAS